MPSSGSPACCGPIPSRPHFLADEKDPSATRSAQPSSRRWAYCSKNPCWAWSTTSDRRARFHHAGPRGAGLHTGRAGVPVHQPSCATSSRVRCWNFSMPASTRCAWLRPLHEMSGKTVRGAGERNQTPRVCALERALEPVHTLAGPGEAKNAAYSLGVVIALPRGRGRLAVGRSALGLRRRATLRRLRDLPSRVRLARGVMVVARSVPHPDRLRPAEIALTGRSMEPRTAAGRNAEMTPVCCRSLRNTRSKPRRSGRHAETTARLGAWSVVAARPPRAITILQSRMAVRRALVGPSRLAR